MLPVELRYKKGAQHEDWNVRNGHPLRIPKKEEEDEEIVEKMMMRCVRVRDSWWFRYIIRYYTDLWYSYVWCWLI